MAGTTIGDLSIQIRADAQKLQSDIKEDLKKTGIGITASAVALGNVISAGIIGGLGAVYGAFKNLAANSIAVMDDVGDTVDSAFQLGVTNEWLVEWRSAFRLVGGDAKALTASIVDLNEKLVQASAMPDGKLADVFNILKMDVIELRQMKPEAMFEKVLASLQAIEDTGAKGYLANAIGGEPLKKLLLESSEGLIKLRQDARDTGAVLSNALGNAADQFGNDGAYLSELWNNFSAQLGVRLVPVFSDLVEMVRVFVHENGGVEPLVKKWGDKFTEVVEDLKLKLPALWEDAKVKAREALDVFNQVKDAVLTVINAIKGADKWAKDNKLLPPSVSAINASTKKELDYIQKGMGINAAGNTGMAKDVDNVVQGIKDAYDYAKELVVNSPVLQFSEPPLPTGTGPVANPSELLGDVPPTLFPGQEITTEAPLKEQASIWDEYRRDREEKEKQTADKSVATEAAANEQRRVMMNVDFEARKRAMADVAALNGKVAADAIQQVRDMHTQNVEAYANYLDMIEEDTAQARKAFQANNKEAITSMVSGWIKGTNSMSDVIASWASRTVDQMVEVILFGQKMGLLTAGLNALGMAMGGTTGAALQGAAVGMGYQAAPAVAGARAEGGMMDAGKSYLVGERGPEIVQPGKSSMVTPNDIFGKLKARQSGGGGSSPIVIQHNYTSGVQRAELAPLAEQIMEKTLALLSGTMQQGGGFRRSMQT